MKLALILALAGITLIASGSLAASPQPPPSQQITKLKQQVQDLRSDKADLQTQVNAQNDVIGDQADTITRLRNRIANQPDPLDVITSRGPDGLWNAMRAIWLAFPTLDPGALCGYDRSNVPGDSDSPTLTSYTFYRFGGC